ncbi:SigE family RNA polymerase sigma factor [Actinomadura sp. DC4]|uniref:SigE family RNA polymerase sigma factor n=1 Tax=Actinomadura sp. DC4 TaxID=3055069 RepID=UPI0025AFD573|nr:SigE family RNA polymerase sigma factor [Actinomadura sp. DC4]MDN3357702.1 SigE family RNA polymerase sigma factor [Actinomadura sp. DC4]
MIRTTRDREFSDFVGVSRVNLLRTACMLTAGDRFLAEDIVQTALARVYVAWPRIRERASAEAYARKAVVTAFLDETRRPWWQREKATGELPEPAMSGDAFGEVDGQLDGGAVRLALAELPPRMRAVIVLRHELDLSIEETASALGCAKGTVKSMNSKALEKLRAALVAAPS